MGGRIRIDERHEKVIEYAVADGMEKQEMRMLKNAVQPDDWNLPEVDLKFCDGNSFSNSRQFDENIRKDGIVLWERQ